eukprot:23853-Eustigmatos_ZCMA.PRE.1
MMLMLILLLLLVLMVVIIVVEVMPMRLLFPPLSPSPLWRSISASLAAPNIKQEAREHKSGWCGAYARKTA